SLQEFPEAEQKALTTRRIKSLVVVPIAVSGILWGFIAFEDCKQKRVWSHEEVSIFKIIAEFLGATIQKNKLENDLIDAKDQAENANKLKDKFLALVAHDFTCHLTSISGFAALALAKTGPEDTPLKTILNHINNSTDQLLNMIDDILKLTKIHGGNIAFKPGFTNLARLVEQAMDVYSLLATNKGIEIINEVSEKATVFVDKILFAEVIKNLLSNAIKFCKRGDNIRMQFDENKDAVIVKDSGTGISQKLLPDLFKPEVKTSTTGTEGEKGTGLALPYCQDIIKNHGGRIEVESKKGQGATFFVIIPRVKPHVLIIDDEKFVHHIMSKVLKPLELEITSMFNGEDALKYLEKSTPHLILCDVLMPGIDGFEVLERLKAEPKTSLIPVVMITADDNPEHNGKAISLGANDFVSKTAKSSELVPRIVKYLF
ncbi:response regulator, partial [Candidatus Riflebacteria bacterium]